MDYIITKEYSSSGDIDDLLEFNRSLRRTVNRYKGKIDEFFNRKNVWDSAKKISNEYEFIFTSLSKYPCVASVVPPSRSYFKLWEMLQQFEDIITPNWNSKKSAIRTAHLAEGPGGFIDSFTDWATEHNYRIDGVHGISLISNNRMVPSWKLSEEKMAKLPITLHRGADGTGDIYKIENIEHFISRVGGDCDLVTADGGFDLFGKYDLQEGLVQRLLLSEVYIACRLQKIGGSFILKVFDLFQLSTIKILFVLQQFYTEFRIVKPLASRPANGEKYILCTGFKLPENAEALFALLRSSIVEQDWDAMPEADVKITVPYWFVKAISDFNTLYTMRQIRSICKTLYYIEIIHHKKQKEFIREIITKHYDQCKTWCRKYNVPYIDTII
jgi:23S rRNA U2552 (ribose-2'-O)-methylase RlmE/FtsJ